MLSVADFGALGDGTDQTAAIQAAEDAVAVKGGVLYFPGGDYAISDVAITKRAGVSWLGSAAAILRPVSNGARVNTLVDCLAVGGFSIRGVTFDWRSTPNDINHQWLANIGFTLCDNFTVEGCKFLGIVLYGIGCNQATNFAIKNNLFVKDVPSPGPQNEAIILTDVSGGSVRGEISGNRLIGTGMMVSGKNIIIADNYIRGWKYGSGITAGGSVTTDFIIRDNYVTGGAGLDSNATVCTGIENWCPNAVISGNVCSWNAGDGIDNSALHCTIVGNVCYNNGQLPGYTSGGISSRSQGGGNGSRSVVANNVCFDNQSTPTQQYGYYDQGGVLTDIIVRGNVCHGNGIAPMLLQCGKLDFAGPKLWGGAADSGRNIGNGGSATGTLTVPGAAIGDLVAVSHSAPLKGVRFWGWISAAGLVTWRMENGTGSSQSIAAGTIRAAVEKPPNYATY